MNRKPLFEPQQQAEITNLAEQSVPGLIPHAALRLGQILVEHEVEKTETRRDYDYVRQNQEPRSKLFAGSAIALGVIMREPGIVVTGFVVYPAYRIISNAINGREYRRAGRRVDDLRAKLNNLESHMMDGDIQATIRN